MMHNTLVHRLNMTIMWTLLLLMVSSISLTTSRSLKYGEQEDSNSIMAHQEPEMVRSLLGSLATLDLDKLPDNYENSSSHVEHINDHDVKVNTNISHHKSNNSESTKYSESKVIDGDDQNGFEREVYQVFSFGGNPGDGESEEEMRAEAQKQMELVQKLEDIIKGANEEMQEFFDNII